MTEKQYKLIIFDMDGTLADRETGELLPGVAEWFYGNGKNYSLSLATNQGGVGLRHWMESSEEQWGNPEKYPTEDSILRHINAVIGRLSKATFPKPPMAAVIESLDIQVFVAFAYKSKKGQWSPTPEDKKDWQDSLHKQYWRQDWRKPAPGMLLEAMSYYEYTSEQTLMVGDSPEDAKAAIRAGIDFQWAWDFFGRDKPDAE